MADTSIEWTDKVWNPTVGCTRVSAGCDNCYALRMARRLAMMGRPEYQDLIANFWANDSGLWFWNGTVRCLSERLDQPLRWRKPRRIFVNSMGDLFHEAVPDEFIDQVFGVIASSPRHTYQVLTKRPKRMRRYFKERCAGERHIWPAAQKIEVPSGIKDPTSWPFPNLWLGVSVEDQKTANERIPLLLQTPAAVRIVSCEPLLGPIDVEALWSRRTYRGDTVSGYMDYDDVDGVIIGGESGPGARPCHYTWIASIRDQCRSAGVPCFIKQTGHRLYYDDGRGWIKMRHPKGADPSEWPEDLRIREFPHG